MRMRKARFDTAGRLAARLADCTRREVDAGNVIQGNVSAEPLGLWSVTVSVGFSWELELLPGCED